MTTATVLLCDLVDSTAKRSAVGDDVADRVIQSIDTMLRGVVSSHRGEVVKGTGDGLLAVFDAASEALNAAVAAHQALDRHNQGAPEFQRHVLRIGISVGDVLYLTDDCHGTPVIEAARLENAAEPGSIYVSNLVRLLAGSRGGHVFEPVGPLVLKGLPEPIETFRVRWAPDEEGTVTVTPVDGDGARVPLPPRLAARPGVGVIGYGSEVKAMADALKRVTAGDGREILLISGEAGTGKTTVAAQLARSAFEAGACVLFGHCEEDLASPYQLFSEALQHYIAHAPDERIRSHVAAHGSGLARLVPALASRVSRLQASRATDADTERFLMFAAVGGLLADVAKVQPVVLVLDDLQWADRASLLLLSHVAATELDTRMLVVGTYRDSELAHAHDLQEALGTLRRHEGVSRVDLGGLDDAGVVDLMQAIVGYTLGAEELDFAHAVYRETDGNPFFVSQVLRHLVETGAVYRDASGRWVSAGSFDQVTLPDSVRQVIGGRVAHLGSGAARVLGLAAVIGRDFDLELLAEAAGLSATDTMDIMDAAAVAALVREVPDTPGHFSFTHSLIQHTVYEDLGATRRALAHRQVAEALEEVCAGRPGERVGELARHWSLATQPVDNAKAIEYSRQAGDAALRALAPSDALRYYLHAQEMLDQNVSPDPVLAIDLAIGLGTAQRQVGQPEFADTLLWAARQAVAFDDTPRLVAAALANDRGFFSNFGAIDTEKVAILEEALSRLPPDDPNRALILAIYCLEIAVGSSLEQREALAEEAVAIAKATDDDAVVVRVFNNVAYPLLVPPRLEESLLRTEEALRRAERLGDPVLHFFAAHWRAQVAGQAGDIEEVEACIERLRSLADQLNQPMLSWVHTFDQAWLAIIRGDTDEAEQIATEALGFGTGQPDAVFIFGAQLVMVHHQRGTLDQLRSVVEEMATSTPSVAGILSGTLAMACIEAGHIDEAHQRVEAFAATDFELQMSAVWITGMIFYADVVIELGDQTFADPLFERLAPWPDQWSNSGATAENPICHYLGGLAEVLGRYDEAEAYFAQSVRMCERVGARFFLAQTQLLWGRMLARRAGLGDGERARDLLSSARTAAVDRGWADVVGRADAALEALER